jgi:hypothetical protein
MMKTNLKPYLYIVLFIAASPLAVCQQNISLSTVAGLVKTEKNFGEVYAVRGGVTFNKLNLEAGYYYSELYKEAQDYKFRIYKYSLTAGYALFSDDRKFKATANMGPALLFVRDIEDDTSLGLDIHLSLGYRLFGFLEAEMGVGNTINDSAPHLIQAFFGFRYNLISN